MNRLLRALAVLWFVATVAACRSTPPTDAADGGMFGSTIPVKQMGTCSNAQILGCNSTTPTFVTMSGSCTITNAGVTTCTTDGGGGGATAGYGAYASAPTTNGVYGSTDSIYLQVYDGGAKNFAPPS